VHAGDLIGRLAQLTKDPALRQGGALMLAMFVYRLCSVGFSLLPALAVLRGLDAATAGTLLGVVRAAGFFGGLLGGALADRYGMKRPLLFGLGASAIGVALAGAPLPLAVLFVSAPFGALGHACFQPMVRLAMGAVVDPEHQKQAVAWMRSANNLASLCGFALVAVASDVGLPTLYLLDAATTTLALWVTWRRVPDVRQLRRATDDADPAAETLDTRRPFFLFSLVMAANMMVYELYMASEAAALARAMPERGVSFFGALMVLNTLVCVVAAVPASRWVREPARAVPLGLALQGLGLAVAAWDFGDLRLGVLSMALVTAGEIAVTALSGHVMLVLSPRGPHAGKAYGAQAVAMDFGRMVGAAAAFPVMVHGGRPVIWAAVIGLVTAVGAWLARPVWHAYAQLGTPRAMKLK
jgi:predicted MFS family arabinose efflux permease